MSGTALTMVSPSRVSTRRNTPCVDGCCGPMLIVMVSRRTPPPRSSLSSTWTCRSSSCILHRPCRVLPCIVVGLDPVSVANGDLVLTLIPPAPWSPGDGWILGPVGGSQRLLADGHRQLLAERYLTAPVRIGEVKTSEG